MNCIKKVKILGNIHQTRLDTDNFFAKVNLKQQYHKTTKNPELNFTVHIFQHIVNTSILNSVPQVHSHYFWRYINLYICMNWTMHISCLLTYGKMLTHATM